MPPILVCGDIYAVFGESIGKDGLLRWRLTAKKIKPTITPITAIPPTTPPTIAPIFTFLLLEVAEVWVEVATAELVVVA